MVNIIGYKPSYHVKQYKILLIVLYWTDCKSINGDKKKWYQQMVEQDTWRTWLLKQIISGFGCFKKYLYQFTQSKIPLVLVFRAKTDCTTRIVLLSVLWRYYMYTVYRYEVKHQDTNMSIGNIFFCLFAMTSAKNI